MNIKSVHIAAMASILVASCGPIDPAEESASAGEQIFSTAQPLGVGTDPAAVNPAKVGDSEQLKIGKNPIETSQVGDSCSVGPLLGVCLKHVLFCQGTTSVAIISTQCDINNSELCCVSLGAPAPRPS